MSLTMFQASVPVCTQILGGLAGVLEKAEAHAAARKIDEAALLTARLYPDMFPLTRQVQAATDFGRNAPGRLAGVELLSLPNTEARFAELRARVATAIAWIGTLTPAQIDGTEDKEISFSAGTRTMSFPGRQYLLQFCLPHFFFHTTTAYDILRHNGVELGKRDFVGSF